MKINKDAVFKQKRNNLLSTIGFLNALNDNLSREEALNIAKEAATNFMIEHYKLIFDGTEPNTHKRFNRFREYYEKYPQISPYCEIVKSTEKYLEVNFHRCPLSEILFSENLFHFIESFCYSDYGFTKKLLPGVNFKRKTCIANSDRNCIMVWKFDKDISP